MFLVFYNKLVTKNYAHYKFLKSVHTFKLFQFFTIKKTHIAFQYVFFVVCLSRKLIM